MPVIYRPEDFNVPDLLVDASDGAGRLLLKCEGMNLAGSIKLKTAAGLLDAATRSGQLRPESVVVESSSGNLGVALSMLTMSRGYPFVCVTDSRCSTAGLRLMRSFGATVEVVTQPGPEGGLLGARMTRIAQLLAADPRRVWLNQYASPANWRAHYETTGPEILRAVPAPSAVFVGVGTSGTAMGVARYLRDHRAETLVVGVDVEGSVSFGGPALPRHIPGLGSAVMPPLLRPDELDELVVVSEAETVLECRSLLARGFLFGGSTGTVVAGARKWLGRRRPEPDATHVAVAPDFGDRYLDSIFDDHWVGARWGHLVGPAAELSAVASP